MSVTANLIPLMKQNQVFLISVLSPIGNAEDWTQADRAGRFTSC